MARLSRLRQHRLPVIQIPAEEECTDEGPINPMVEAKRLGALTKKKTTTVRQLFRNSATFRQLWK